MKCIIFDIDGTLVRSYDFDGECLRSAIKNTLGDVAIRDDWGDYHHVTDEGILQEVYADNSLSFTNSIDIRSRFGCLIHQYLDNNPSACEQTPGAQVLFKQLRQDEKFKVGVATGGWGHTGSAKLNHANIEHENVPFCSSDDAVSRIEIMEKCRSSMGDLSLETIYIGDGIWDMQATKALGWNFIGIGQRLKGQCETWAPDFQSDDFKSLIESPSA